MRVISGTAKGSSLYSLDGNLTRPTLDRIKESLFNIIQNDVKNATIVLDLFAGSGALAIEALSRGAKFAYLCDKSNEAIEIIKKNIAKTHLDEKCKIMKCNYLQALENLKNKCQFDLIFIDPPYATTLVQESVKNIIEFNLLAKEGKIIIETDEEERILEELKQINVNVCDLRKYGRVKLIFLNRKG